LISKFETTRFIVHVIGFKMSARSLLYVHSAQSSRAWGIWCCFEFSAKRGPFI